MDRKTVALSLFACVFSSINSLIRYEATNVFLMKNER